MINRVLIGLSLLFFAIFAKAQEFEIGVNQITRIKINDDRIKKIVFDEKSLVMKTDQASGELLLFVDQAVKAFDVLFYSEKGEKIIATFKVKPKIKNQLITIQANKQNKISEDLVEEINIRHLLRLIVQSPGNKNITNKQQGVQAIITNLIKGDNGLQAEKILIYNNSQQKIHIEPKLYYQQHDIKKIFVPNKNIKPNSTQSIYIIRKIV
jgi:hypothetical protein